jgi:o-succinylbenzoate synthase
MSIQANYFKRQLIFKQPAGTSRGLMHTKDSWFIVLKQNKKIGIGECGYLKGLSIDNENQIESKLQWLCDNINQKKHLLFENIQTFPALIFCLEQAFLSLESENIFDLFPSLFTQNEAPIIINGLVWMGDYGFMKKQISEKIKQNFSCIKLKIGAIDFEKELNLLKHIRQDFSEKDIEIRVDANGAFTAKNALEKIKILSDFQIHSIEQPIQPKQFEQMAKLCLESPIDIALDEELIGVMDFVEKENLLKTIKPPYIILKPSLLGGFKHTNEWIELAQNFNIQWWVTSALESNIGLNAIAQYTFTKENPLPQGLGTGGLYENNFECPLVVKNGVLVYDSQLNWFQNIFEF